MYYQSLLISQCKFWALSYKLISIFIQQVNGKAIIFWGDYVFFTQIFCVSTRIQFLEPCGKHRQLGAQLKLYLICAAGTDKRFAFNVRLSFARWEWLLFDPLFIKYLFNEILRVSTTTRWTKHGMLRRNMKIFRVSTPHKEWPNCAQKQHRLDLGSISLESDINTSNQKSKKQATVVVNVIKCFAFVLRFNYCLLS